MNLDRLNALLNAPDIRPFVAPGNTYLDATRFMTRPGAVVLERPEGMLMCTRTAPGVFDVHFLFPTGSRGAAAKAACQSMFTELFTEHDARVIQGNISRYHRAARLFAASLGCKAVGSSVHPVAGPVVQYRMEREQWALSETLSAV